MISRTKVIRGEPTPRKLKQQDSPIKQAEVHFSASQTMLAGSQVFFCFTQKANGKLNI